MRRKTLLNQAIAEKGGGGGKPVWCGLAGKRGWMTSRFGKPIKVVFIPSGASRELSQGTEIRSF